MNYSCKTSNEDIINTLQHWIKSFSWEENDNQTDAEMEFTIGGIAGSHLEDMIDISLVNTKIIKQVVLRKAEQFIDVHVIEELNWEIVDSMDEVGCPLKNIHVQASIHLAESGFPFDDIDESEDGIDESEVDI
jgi:hypothetical protein